MEKEMTDYDCEIEFYGTEVETGYRVARCKTHERNFFAKSDTVRACPYRREVAKTVLAYDGEEYEFTEPTE